MTDYGRELEFGYFLLVHYAADPYVVDHVYNWAGSSGR
jgi:hypothetical protein